MEAIGTLAGGIAHDFNNILASLMGYAELSLQEAEKGSELESDINEILNASQRARELVNQILTFARQSGDEIIPIRVDLIVKEVLKFIRSSIPSNIEIRQEIQSKSKIMGNATQLHQVLMNLCSNASHAMIEEGGQLTVTLTEIELNSKTDPDPAMLRDGPYIKLQVIDTGDGIPDHIMDRIFEPYFTTKDVGVGTGMGLAVVNSIVKDFKGAIRVESNAEKGSCFTLLLPVTKSQHKQQRKPAKGSVKNTGNAVLFVDDEKLIARVTKMGLEKLGYRVVSFTNPKEALESFEKDSDCFDIVVSDLTMPMMTGEKLLAKIRKIRPDIPFILCSGYIGKHYGQKAESDADAFVRKPYSMPELSETIQTAISAKSGLKK